MKKIQVLSQEKKIEKLVKSYAKQIASRNFLEVFSGPILTPSKAKRFAESRCKLVPEYIREQVIVALSKRVYEYSREA
jgi:hypothetical protein